MYMHGMGRSSARRLGQYEALIGAALASQTGGGGSAGTQPPVVPPSASSAVNAAINPAVTTVISPQISPSFVQQFQPSGSAVSTGASQGGSPVSLPGSALPIPGVTPGVIGAPPPIQLPSTGIDWSRWQTPIIVASVALLAVAAILRMKKKPGHVPVS
jgi:hypothetical protein